MISLRAFLVRLAMRRALRKSKPKSYAHRRALMDQNSKIFKAPGSVTVLPTSVGTRKGEWLVPKGAQSGTAVLYLHGGAYTAGSLASHRSLASKVAETSGVSTLLLDYRLAPENPYPAAIEDAVEAFMWIQTECGVPANRIIIAGDSAGGGLTLACALRLRDAGSPTPRALVLISPWTNLAMSGASAVEKLGVDPFFSTTADLVESARAYAGGSSVEHPEISPLNATYNGMPKIFVQVGENEILLSDSTDLKERVEAYGGEIEVDVWPAMWHVWQVFWGYMPEAKTAVAQIGKKIRTYLDVSES